ncbi:MAG: peptidoglycan DD-metalloendopeptidase family protein [Chloroflexota bacterium]
MVTPSNTGEGNTALANTRGAWVNLRTGPGTNYDDIGDIRNNTLVLYYPSTQQGDWLYLEQYGLAGWVHGGFVNFEPVDADPPTAPQVETPYDGHVALWHWQGGAVQENSIEELVINIKTFAPNVTQLFVKTSEGTSWQGEFDRKPAMAVNGPDDITRWADVLERYDMEFHAWCVPRGIGSIAEEAQRMIETAQHPQCKSLILDVEPYAGYWDGTQAQIREMMVLLRRAIGAEYHLGMVIDPRPQHYESIYPLSWQPFIDSIHPMVYWRDFTTTPENTLQTTYSVWLQYGKPICPILQVAAPTTEIREAHSLSTARYGAKSLSWWRYGVGTTAELSALNLPIPDSPVTPTPLPPGGGTGGSDPNNGLMEEVLINPSDNRFARGTYTGEDEFGVYVQRMGWPVYYTRTASRQSKVWAMWTPNVAISGRYAVDVYIHKPFSTTGNARYKIHGVRGEAQEVLVPVNQRAAVNGWFRLGVFDFDSNLPNSGRVFLNDATGEEGRFITFDAIRWQREVTVNPNPNVPGATSNGVIVVNGVVYCDGFDMPVGNRRNSGDRAGTRVWQSGWRDASPYPEPYLYSSFLGRYTSVHTGADLNWGSGAYSDVGQEIYSIASGTVTFANERRSWGNLVVIQHDPYIKDGRKVSSRYAHLQRMDVRVGDRVARGQQIGTLGGTRGTPGASWVPHLHFDITPAETLERNPEDWPPLRNNFGKSVSQMTNAEYNSWLNAVQQEIIRTYFDPRVWIQNNRPNR